jgi:uncharacterized protein (TIGR03000 family)
MRALVLSAIMGFGILGLGVDRASADARSRDPATIRVTLPADAKLWFDGQLTRSTSAERWFITPPLDSGKSFSYRLQAEVLRGGGTITVQQTITVQSGRESTISLDIPGSSRYYASESTGTRVDSSYSSSPQSPVMRPASVPDGPVYRWAESGQGQ